MLSSPGVVHVGTGLHETAHDRAALNIYKKDDVLTANLTRINFLDYEGDGAGTVLLILFQLVESVCLEEKEPDRWWRLLCAGRGGADLVACYPEGFV